LTRARICYDGVSSGDDTALEFLSVLLRDFSAMNRPRATRYTTNIKP